MSLKEVFTAANDFPIKQTQLHLKDTFNCSTSIKEFQEKCSHICRSLQSLNKHHECLKWIGSVFSVKEELNKTQLQFLVGEWIRCKLLLNKAGLESNESKHKTISSYINWHDGQESRLADVYFMELNCYKLLKKHPPILEYHALCNIVKSCSFDKRHLLAKALMLSLLHAWPESFCSLSDVPDMSDLSWNVESLWEAKVIITFYLFLQEYEDSLSKVLQSRIQFSESESDTCDGNVLSWYPFDLNALDRNSLFILVKLLNELPYDHIFYVDEILQCYNVLVALLDLIEEKILLRNFLCDFERVLKCLMNKLTGSSKAALYVRYILLKCASSNLDFDLHLYQEAFDNAREANHFVEEYRRTFESEETKHLQSRYLYARIESKICLAQACGGVAKISDALHLIEEITNDNFLSSTKIRSSRSSALASSHFNLFLSHFTALNPTYSSHPLHNALLSATTTCVRLDAMCPGICQMMKCFESSAANRWLPQFGKNTIGSSNDMVIQFDCIQHLFKSLYRVSYLWLKSGNLRFALLYITDGIILSRSLCLPEKELIFQQLMVELSVMEQNTDRILDELLIYSDALNYVAKLNSKHEKGGRLKWFTPYNGKKFDDEDVLNKTMKNINEEDEDLVCSITMDVSSVVCHNDNINSTSPILKRKQNMKKNSTFMTHGNNCSCRLCSNLILQYQHCKLFQAYADYLELLGHGEESLQCLEDAKKSFPAKSYEINGATTQKPSLIQSMELIACLAEKSFKFSSFSSSKQYVEMGLQYVKDNNLHFNNFSLSYFFHFAGMILLDPPIKRDLDVNSYSDILIDFLSNHGENKVEVVPQSITSKFENLSLTHGKQTSTKKTTKKPPTPKIEIFNDADEPVNKVVSTRQKKALPRPNFEPNSLIKSKSKSSAQKKMKKFNFCSDSSDDEQVSISLKTPAKHTRASRRLATKNVIIDRKVARTRYREKCGPVYTNEEIESARPARRSRRKENTEEVSKETNELDFEEIECARDNTANDNITTPLLNPFVESPSSPDVEHKFDFSDLKCEECLKKTVKSSFASCDFFTCKSAFCLLALHHNKEESPHKSSACHALSVGTSLRISFHINLKMCLKSVERSIKKSSATNKIDMTQEHYLSSVENIIEFTHPKKISQFVDEPHDFINSISSALPQDWTVCLLSTFKNSQNDVMMITRLRKDDQPYHLQLQDASIHCLKKKFDSFIEYNVKGMKTTEKSLWWTQRRNASQLLQSFTNELEQFLGCHAGVLLGRPINEECEKEITTHCNKVIKAISEITKSTLNEDFRNLVEIYLYVWKDLQVEEKSKVILNLLHSAHIPSDNKLVLIIADLFEDYSKHLHSHKCKRGHVILILDKDVQSYPWESLSVLKDQSVSRMPSIDMLMWQLHLNELDSHAKADLESVAFVLNPKGDLIKTEERFSDWFSSIESWRGIISRIPRRSEWISYISNYDVFIFCGHGSGSAFMSQEVISRRRNRACALLMGCSSGLLKEQGVTEPDGIALAYLASGSPCALTCLWAVTDKDIDRYLAKCLTEWMKEGTSLTEVTRKAESACKIPKLNGSACVVYGIPVRSTNSVLNWIKTIPEFFKDTLL